MNESAGGLGQEDRENFLRLPWHADLIRAAETGEWPDPPR